MGKLNVMFLFIFLFSLTFVSAESIGQRQDAEINEPYIISQPCATCTYVNISVFTKNGVVLDNVAMTDNGSTWTYTFTPNVSLRHDVNGIGDINGQDDSFAFWFNVGGMHIAAYIILVLFLAGLVVGFRYLEKSINYESWYNSLLNKYQTKNFVKLALGAISYNLMKNSFIIYYLFGLPIMLIMMDITYTFGVDSMIQIISVLFYIYLIGILLVGLVFLSFVQEWSIEAINTIKDMKWGIE